MDAALLPEGMEPGNPNVQICPNCGQGATFKEHQAHHVETHGLDCGPYEHWDEEWLTCSMCGEKTGYDEIRRCNTYARLTA